MAVQITEFGFAAPPVTYQEWLDCFGYIKAHPEGAAALRSLRGGAVCREKRTLDLFLQRMDDMLRETLNRRIARFVRRVNDLLEEGDVDGVELLSIRFTRGLGDLFFFESLRDLPRDSRVQFRDGYARQLELFWSGLVAEMRAQAEQSGDERLDELAYRLARLNGIWHGKECTEE